MADARIPDFPSITGANLADGDLLPVVDVSDTTDHATGSDAKATVLDVAYAAGQRIALYNAAVAQQTWGAVDKYLTGSSIALPVTRLQAKTMYRCMFEVVKTSTTGSTSAPVLQVRIGTNGTTADTSRGSMTFNLQTAVIDEGVIEYWATFRTVGSGTSAVLQSVGRLTHRNSTTGLATGISTPKIATSAGFDSTVASSIIGLSCNFGTSFVGTTEVVQAELFNLA